MSDEPEDAARRIERDIEEINKALRREHETGSEMGRGPEIVADSGVRVPEGWDLGISADGKAVLVPPPGDETARFMDKMLAAKREHLRKEIEAQAKETEARQRAEGMTSPTSRDMPRYDSPERRQAIAAHLSRMGIPAPEQEVRRLHELGQGVPADQIPVRRAEKEREDQVKRKEGPERGKEPPAQEPGGQRP